MHKKNYITTIKSDLLQARGNSKKIVLVVDDDEGIQEVIAEAINTLTPYQALVTRDGFQALEVIKTITPHLFLIDYILPMMNGLELYDQVHQMKGLEQIPTLLMSANVPQQEVDRRRMRSIVKPFDLPDLLDTIEALLTP